jgi:putative heme degradation protein
VTSVLRENVTLQENKAVIPLWTRWDAVLELVHALGPVLSIGRNSHAVLGRIGCYPKVFCAPCGHCGSAADGTMEFYFGAWDHAQVTVEEKTGGWLYAVEFFDAWNETLHKICLTGESDLETFREWVELNQSTPESSFAGRSGDRAACSASPVPPPSEGTHLLRSGALDALFNRLIEEKQPVQVVVGNEHFVQGADLTPLSLRTTGQWVFVSDEKNGLHLRSGQTAEICLQRVFWQDNASALVLKVFEPEGRMACVLAPPRESAAPDWDDLIQEIAAPFLITNNQP